MGQLVVIGAALRCSFGTTPSNLVVTPESRVNAAGLPAATIMDNAPIKNVPPFGMCNSLANPQVAAATAAAQGVLTPQPCIPATSSPWMPGSPTVLINNKPALHNNCKLMCSWGGVIQIVSAGQATVNVK